MQKVVQVDREKIIFLIEKILEEPLSTELFIPCHSKKNQQDTHRCVIRELKIRSEFAPEDAEKITHRLVFRDSKFWVVLKHIEPILEKAYLKKNEETSKIDIPRHETKGEL